MFKIIPDYYKDFKCIAGECKHTCCAGWEIDIDEDSLERYKQDGIAHISEEGTPHFVMQGERCPYLNTDNLCDLYMKYGEDYLCQICTDHPRFRNFWHETEEIGLGLSCEAAARLILGREEPMELIIMDAETEEQVDFEDYLALLPEDEQYLFDLRDQLLMQAEMIDEPMVARLYEYFLFRQLPDALYDGLLNERIAFCERSVKAIVEMWNGLEDPSFEAKCEIARAYSDEIEYDTEKLNMILKEF